MMCKPMAPPVASPLVKSRNDKADPLVCALNTLMFGMLLHFGTILSIEGNTREQQYTNEYASNCTSCISLPYILLLHEYWVYLQHANVLSNPHLQDLDRSYGIALLKNNQHWAIAGTLSSYWCRESVGMFLTLPFLQITHELRGGGNGFSKTQYLILYSLVYHAIKSRGVRSDATRRYSTQFGIMRLVIDRFFLDSLEEFSLSLLRLFLQGLDTYIHYCIVRDIMLLLGSSVMTSIHMLFVFWVIHATLNQLFRCSTASVIVQCWHLLTTKQPLVDTTKCEISSCGSSSSEINVASIDRDDEFVVRRLLDSKRVPAHLRGRDGSASKYVDKAVRIESAIALITAFFMVGLGKAPLEAISGCQPYILTDIVKRYTKQTHNAIIFCWLYWSILYGLWALLLRARRPNHSQNNQSNHCWRTLVNVADMMVIIAIQTVLLPLQKGVWFVCLSITVKSFLQAQKSIPKIVLLLSLAIEFAAKLILLKRLLTYMPDDDIIHPVTSMLTMIWVVWVVCNPSPTTCEVAKDQNKADAVFLGHPAGLSDCWALWLLPYSLRERWSPPFWTSLLWPFHYIVGIYVCKYRTRMFGDAASHFCCDDVCYGNTRMQNWVASHFGRHFITHKPQVRYNIEAAARHAENIGIKVLCLGALNKAESINGGGVSVAKCLGPNRRISIIHGNHLTAAAVVETIHQCFGDKSEKFFLTGASSKVGWAVAQSLKKRGHSVLCHSTDEGRRQFFEANKFASASTLAEGAAYTSFWVVGKYDTDVAREIPQHAVAVVFSVPHSLSSRNDLRVIEAGTLHIDLEQLDRPRLFTNKLKEHEIFACHAASAVAVHRLRTVARIDEVGPVNTDEMESWLIDAKKLGFSVPPYESITSYPTQCCQEISPVIIVGCGPAGLCAAAGLSIRNIPFIVLDAETDTDTFGSWNVLKRFGANVTTRKKWCNLTGYEMNNKDFPCEYVSAGDYQRYLKQYADRFSVTRHIRRGVKVVSVEKRGHVEPSWKITAHVEGEYEMEEIFASSVVIATGKHGVNSANTSGHLVKKLDDCNIPHAHSTAMTPDKWKLAFNAAKNGSLCIVGFGNSAADIASAILANSNQEKIMNKPMIHVAARTVPPVFPQKKAFLRVDTIGYVMQWLPLSLQEYLLGLLWRVIPTSKRCDSAFPSHLKRWSKINGRIPVIDKGRIAFGFTSGQLKGHGPIQDVDKSGGILFADHSHADMNEQRIKIEMVILATGYKVNSSIADREDRPSGLYKLGFGRDNFLPLHTMCKDAQVIVEDIAAVYRSNVVTQE